MVLCQSLKVTHQLQLPLKNKNAVSSSAASFLCDPGQSPKPLCASGCKRSPFPISALGARVSRILSGSHFLFPPPTQGRGRSLQEEVGGGVPRASRGGEEGVGEEDVS